MSYEYFFCQCCGEKFPISERKEVSYDDGYNTYRCFVCAAKKPGVCKLDFCKTCGRYKEVVVFEDKGAFHGECFDCTLGKVGFGKKEEIGE